ncbi:hypothetical protein LshimejAT787_0601700 [Lyophyllum shimeji]|uniref:Uncharacterized protein n=1 Tax=Lyophyllum shimeji TaxID=47721 RepID=A0A9P3UMV2_LYOSH|nr:hypothetical protein LshimejAT787_0601700 [Lyophyllum shimeji]
MPRWKLSRPQLDKDAESSSRETLEVQAHTRKSTHSTSMRRPTTKNASELTGPPERISNPADANSSLALKRGEFRIATPGVNNGEGGWHVCDCDHRTTTIAGASAHMVHQRQTRSRATDVRLPSGAFLQPHPKRAWRTSVNTSDMSTAVTHLRHVLRKWKKGAYSEKEMDDNLVAYMLDHEYSEADHLGEAKTPKGADADLIANLRGVAEEPGHTVCLANPEYHVQGYQGDHGIMVTGSAADARPEDNLIPKEPFEGQTPDDEGYMGNGDGSLDHGTRDFSS